MKEYREQGSNNPTRACWKRIIKDLKIYYNFFTDSSFKFKTFVYSDWKNALSLEGFYKDEEILVANNISPKEEKIIEKEELNFEKLYSKRKKIYEQLSASMSNRVNSKIKSKAVENKTKMSYQNTNINYCLVEKSKCVHCKQESKYSIEMVSNLKYKMVIEELKFHNHPSTRLIDKTQRNLAQSKMELINHYKTRH